MYVVSRILLRMIPSKMSLECINVLREPIPYLGPQLQLRLLEPVLRELALALLALPDELAEEAHALQVLPHAPEVLALVGHGLEVVHGLLRHGLGRLLLLLAVVRVLLRRLRLLVGPHGLGELQAPDERHAVAGLPLQRPVGHQPLEELVLLLHADHPGDLLHLLPWALWREVHEAAEQHRHRGLVRRSLLRALGLGLGRGDAKRGHVVQLGLAVRVLDRGGRVGGREGVVMGLFQKRRYLLYY